jgi:hypothetical protein
MLQSKLGFFYVVLGVVDVIGSCADARCGGFSFYLQPCSFLLVILWMTYLYFPVYIFLSLWLYSPLDLGGFFSFLILYTVGRTPWTGDEPVARPLPTHRTTQTQTCIPWVGFEPTIPVFERAKTVHALYSAAAVIGSRMRTGMILD